MLCAHSLSENIELCNGPYFHFAAGVKDVDTGGEFKRAGPGPENWLRLGSDTPESDSNVRSTLLCWPMK